MEGLAIDKRFGFFVNHDPASYEESTHAGIAHQDVIFLDETDLSHLPKSYSRGWERRGRVAN